MLVPLNGPARLAAHPNHEKAGLQVDLEQLEGDALLIGYERQVAFTAVKRRRRPAAGGNLYDDGLNDVSVSDC
jgi:hypothetical protein